MGNGTFGKIIDILAENKPIILTGIPGFIFFLAAIRLMQTEKLLYGIISLACALCLFYFSWYHFRMKGTPYYGQPITSHESWEDMPWWKKLALLVFVILFLLLWGYLFIIWIMRGGIPFESLCIGSCDGY